MTTNNTRLEQVFLFVKEQLQDFGIDEYWIADQVENCMTEQPETSANLYSIAREISSSLLKKLNSYAHQQAAA